MPNSDDKETLLLLRSISDKADQTREMVSSIDKKLELHIQKTEYELKNIHELDGRQNELLDEHIKGVNTLKEWCDDHERANQERFQRLEQPRKWLEMTKQIVLWIGSVAGALAAIIHFFGKWLV